MYTDATAKRKLINFLVLALVCFATFRLSLLNISLSGPRSRTIKPTTTDVKSSTGNVSTPQKYTAFDYGTHVSTHPGVFNATRWLSVLSDKIALLDTNYLVNGSKVRINTDLIFYEAEADTGRILDDIRLMMAHKRPDAIAVIIFTSAYQYVPSRCPDRTTLFYVINTNKNSNCVQTQITHYPKLRRLDTEYIEAWRDSNRNKPILQWDKPRPLLAGFVGSSWTYPYRRYMALLNKHPDVRVSFNEDFWQQYTNLTYLQRVQAEHYNVLRHSVFSFCPRGVGVSSIRFLESLIFGSIPVLMDDNLQPFGHPLDFAVRYTFTHQNASLPATKATKSSLEGLYRSLQLISRNATELARRRQGMLDFFYSTLAPDLQHPRWSGTYPLLPFASTIMRDVETAMKAIRNK